MHGTKSPPLSWEILYKGITTNKRETPFSTNNPDQQINPGWLGWLQISLGNCLGRFLLMPRQSDPDPRKWYYNYPFLCWSSVFRIPSLPINLNDCELVLPAFLSRACTCIIETNDLLPSMGDGLKTTNLGWSTNFDRYIKLIIHSFMTQSDLCTRMVLSSL